MPSKHLLVVHSSRGLPNAVVRKAKRHRYLLKMHSDHRKPDIQAGVRTDLLHRHRIRKMLIRLRRKGSARLGLRNHIDYIGIRYSITLNDDRAV